MGTQGKPRHYKDLLIWQKGMVLAKLVYKLTARFPPQEKFGLTAQLRGGGLGAVRHCRGAGPPGNKGILAIPFSRRGISG
jgi:23S rRNA-intervening sequence protein